MLKAAHLFSSISTTRLSLFSRPCRAMIGKTWAADCRAGIKMPQAASQAQPTQSARRHKTLAYENLPHDAGDHWQRHRVSQHAFERSLIYSLQHLLVTTFWIALQQQEVLDIQETIAGDGEVTMLPRTAAQSQTWAAASHEIAFARACIDNVVGRFQILASSLLGKALQVVLHSLAESSALVIHGLAGQVRQRTSFRGPQKLREGQANRSTDLEI